MKEKIVNCIIPKISILFLITISLTFGIPTYSQAAIVEVKNTNDGTVGDFLSDLLSELVRLVQTVGDTAMEGLNSFMLGLDWGSAMLDKTSANFTNKDSRFMAIYR